MPAPYHAPPSSALGLALAEPLDFVNQQRGLGGGVTEGLGAHDLEGQVFELSPTEGRSASR